MNTGESDYDKKLLKRESMPTPTLDDRLGHLLGAVQALWHISEKLDDEIDQDALRFIHEALLEQVRAIRGGLNRSEHGDEVFSIPCPSNYRS